MTLDFLSEVYLRKELKLNHFSLKKSNLINLVISILEARLALLPHTNILSALLKHFSCSCQINCKVNYGATRFNYWMLLKAVAVEILKGINTKG